MTVTWKLPCCLALSAAVLASGCAAPSQPYLDQLQADCAAGKPTQNYCAEMLPRLQSQVDAEKSEQAGKVATGFLAVLGAVAVGAAVGYAASHPAPPPPTVVVVCHWNCW
jgi:hypothetical protein